MSDDIAEKKHCAGCSMAFQQAGAAALQTYGEQAIVLAGAIINRTLMHLQAVAPSLSRASGEPSLRDATLRAVSTFDSVGGLLFGILERLSDAERGELNRLFREPLEALSCGCEASVSSEEVPGETLQ